MRVPNKLWPTSTRILAKQIATISTVFTRELKPATSMYTPTLYIGYPDHEVTGTSVYRAPFGRVSEEIIPTLLLK